MARSGSDEVPLHYASRLCNNNRSLSDKDLIRLSRNNASIFREIHLPGRGTRTGGQVVDGKVSSWLDFDDSDAVQITIDGKTYLTHYTNVCLINE